MTDYREILRLDSLGFSKQSIADSCNCARNTVKSVLDAAQVNGIKWQGSSTPNNEALRKLLFRTQMLFGIVCRLPHRSATTHHRINGSRLPQIATKKATIRFETNPVLQAQVYLILYFSFLSLFPNHTIM